MKRLKTSLIIMFSLLLLITITLGSFTTYSFISYHKEKKAIIILPGLFASGLYNETTGKGIWDPFPHIDLSFGDLMEGLDKDLIVSLLLDSDVLHEMNKLFENDNYGAEDSMLNLVSMNEDGTPVVPSVKPVPWDSDSRLRYGVINAQKEMYDSLESEYGDAYEVQVFNYDFRLDNRSAADYLEQYINDQGYTDVILVSHSNGGHVAALYLAKSQENRDKVSKYISYMSPYFGSFAAISILENIDSMLQGIANALESVPGLSVDNIKEVLEKQFTSLVNMYTPYQLLPTYEMLSTKYAEEKAAIYINNELLELDSPKDLWDFYCSRPWARLSDNSLRVQMQSWLEYRDAFMVTMDNGEKVLSTTLVDTTYYSGLNKPTINRIYYTGDDDNLNLTTTSTSVNGDGTVSLLSAVAGEIDYKKMYIFNDTDHYGVNIRFSKNAESMTYAAIDKVLKDNTTWQDLFWRKLLRS